MATLTLTPDAESAPPSILVEVEGGAGEVVSSVSLTRDGAPVLGSAMAGFTTATYTDYSAPYGVPCTYRAIGTSTVQTWPALWSEAWASLASWTGSGWSVASGVASSEVFGATLSRSGALFKIDVAHPSYVRLELLNSTGAVVASVSCTTSMVVSGSTSTTIAAVDSFSAWIVGSTLLVETAAATATVPILGTVASVRLTSLAGSETIAPWVVGGALTGVAVDASENVYVCDNQGSAVYKYSSAGTLLLSWSSLSPGPIAIDSLGNSYVLDATNTIHKYDPSGSVVTTWLVAGQPTLLAVDSSANVYVTDYTNKLVRKFSSSGSPITTWSTTGTPSGIAIDSSDNIYVGDRTNKLVRKFTTSGSAIATWSTTIRPVYVAVDASGSVYVCDSIDWIWKFTSSGAHLSTFPLVDGSGIAVGTSGTLYATNYAPNLLRYAQKPSSVGALATYQQSVASDTTFDLSESATLSPDSGWLIHPKTPALSIPLARDGQTEAALNLGKDAIGETSRESQAGRQRAAGSTDDAVFTIGERSAPSLPVTGFTLTEAAWSQIVNLLKDESPVMFRFPPSWLIPMEERWYSVGDYTEQFVSPDSRLRMVTLPLSPAATPYVIVQPVWNEAALVLRYATEADVLAAYATEYDKLIDNPRP